MTAAEIKTKLENLVREATIQEGNRDRAINELEELGYKVTNLDEKGLAALEAKISEDLTEAVSKLEKALEQAESAVEAVEQAG